MFGKQFDMKIHQLFMSCLFGFLVIASRFALLVYWRASKVFLYKLILYKTQAD